MTTLDNRIQTTTMVPDHDTSTRRKLNHDANVTCTSCGRSGHHATLWFCLVGYPEWWGTRPRTTNNYLGEQSNTPSTE